MALLTERKTIGALDVEVTQLPYFRAQRLFVRLLRLAGPALTGLVTLVGKSGRAAAASLLDADAGQLVEVLGEFFAKLDPGEVESLTKEILDTAVIYRDGKCVRLLPVIEAPDALGGDVLTGLKVQAFALSVHFGNFSGALGGLAALSQRAQSPSAASSTSTDGKGANS